MKQINFKKNKNAIVEMIKQSSLVWKKSKFLFPLLYLWLLQLVTIIFNFINFDDDYSRIILHDAIIISSDPLCVI